MVAYKGAVETKRKVGVLRDPATRWGKDAFMKYRGCVALIATEGLDGALGIGTCFHVGEGVFVTARHVVEGRSITEIGFDDGPTSLSLLEDPKHWGKKPHGSVTITRGPLYHADPGIDLACFVAEPHPKRSIPLGGHLDSWMSQYELVLYRTLVLGYPPVQVTNKPLLVASLGEVNALAELRAAPHPHWSSTASFRRSKSSTSAATRTDRPGGPVLPRRGPTAWSAAAAARAVLAVCSCVQDQAVPRR